MNVKKKKTIIAASVITGVCVLAGSAFANYSTANGYDVLKTGAKSMVGMKNYTFDAVFKVNIDDAEVWNSTVVEKYDSNNGNPSLSLFEKTISEDGEDIYQSLIRDGKSYYPTYEIGQPFTSWETHPNYDSSPGMFDIISSSNRNTADKVIKFVELLSDTVVGDLKNNFIYVGSSEYGGAKYEIALDKIQIPELINAGISAICALNEYDDSYYYDDSYDHRSYSSSLEPNEPEYFMYHNCSITSVSCNFETDSESRLADTIMTVNVASEDGHTMEMIFEMKLYDIGSTAPDFLDSNAVIIDETDDSEAAETAIVD